MSATCSTVACCPPDDYAYNNSEVTLWAIGDYGDDSADETAVKNLIDADNPNAIFTLGDNSYSGNYTNDVYNDYAEWLDRGDFYPAPGNHDWDAASLASYLAFFTGVANQRYYRQRIGPVELFMLDSDTREPDGTSAGSAQGVWLQTALGLSDAPWKIVVAHHAPYSSDVTHGSSAWMQWPFSTWGADVVMSGHAHDYERLLVSDFPYIIGGFSGESLRGFGTPLATSVVRYNAKFGAIKVTASQNKLAFRALSVDGDLIDAYKLET